MNDKLKIEKLSGKNFRHFIYLIKKLADYEKLEPPNKNAIKRLREDGLLKNPKFQAYIGKYNGKHVAYVIFYMNYSSLLAMPTLFLEDIFVLEEYREKGIGQKMFDFCVKESKARKCGRMDLCVLNWNIPAIKFYEKNGLERMDWAFYRLNFI